MYSRLILHIAGFNAQYLQFYLFNLFWSINCYMWGDWDCGRGFYFFFFRQDYSMWKLQLNKNFLHPKGWLCLKMEQSLY